jgi:predicted alpha-1,6-mannanase (GH76 family)
MPEEGGRYLAEVQGYLRGLGIYWDPRSTPPGYASYPPPPNGGGGDLYYDDNAWVAIPLLQYHRLADDPAGLAAARRVFDFLLSGWDDDPRHAAPGGIFWVKADWSRNRNTVSTAPAALAGLHLFELTEESRTWDWAVRMFGWLNRYLLSPDGLYWDHVRPDGAVDQGIFAYNQGAAVGVSLMLERITGDRAYLGWARRTADAMLAIFAEQGLEAQAPGFTALFARYLLALWARTEDERYRAFVEQYAAFTWQTRRDPTSDLFRFDLQGTASEVEQGIIAQAAMTQINALLAWPASQFRLLV